jgi:hypothetical protein
MTENNTNINININEDIYKKFNSTLLIEIKKIIKKFQWRKASRKYKENNKYRYTELNKLSKKYYYNTPGLKEKISYYRKLRYQTDEDFRNKRNLYIINYYKQHKEEILKKAKTKYQLKKNKAINNLEINNNVIPSY